MKEENWTEKEEEYLKERYGKDTYEKIADELNRTIPSVRGKAQYIGITKDRIKWTDEKVEFLKENYGLMPVKDIAEELNTTVPSIQHKANRLEIKRADKYLEMDFHPKVFKRKLSSVELSYLGGLMDGEGSLSIYINSGNENRNCKLRPFGCITTTSERIIDWLKKRLNFTYVYDRRNYPRSEGGRTTQLYWRNFRIYNLLKHLEEYLVEKKELAQLMMKYIEGRRKMIHTQTKKYRKRDIDLFLKIRRENLSEDEFEDLKNKIERKVKNSECSLFEDYLSFILRF